MKANPGGQIPPSEVLGRDALIQRLWRVLERQSLVLSAERRIGKTCVVKKMVEEAQEDKLSVYHDLEKIRTPMEFVETVFRDVEDYLSGLKRTTELMLYNIKKRNGEDAAMEILDTLRSLRQMHPGLRMVFTGSIGLHNVISSLKRAGYANDPTNDMHTEDVPPLSPADAQDLARRLLEGEGVQVEDLRATAQAIAEAVDGIPYFIHHVVDQMVERGGAVNAATASEIVDACLTDPHDRWHMRYYRERIDTYYASEECPFALNLLDVLSGADRPLQFDDLFNLLKSHLTTEDHELARQVLTLLQRDHYILQQADGAFRFRFPLIQRCWRLHRGLGT